MKIKGQHGEFGREEVGGRPALKHKRQVEIGQNERIGIKFRNRKTGEEREVLSYFMPGVLTLEWEQGAKLSE